MRRTAANSYLHFSDEDLHTKTCAHTHMCTRMLYPSQVLEVRRTGELGKLNSLVYTALFANNFGWLLYGFAAKVQSCMRQCVGRGACVCVHVCLCVYARACIIV